MTVESVLVLLVVCIGVEMVLSPRRGDPLQPAGMILLRIGCAMGSWGCFWYFLGYIWKG